MAKRTDIYITAGIVLVAVALGLGCYLWLNGSETRHSQSVEKYAISSLDCTASQPNDAFFAEKNAQKRSHKVKITFREDKADKITYTYEGTFSDNTTAEAVSSRFHADYNIYMGDNGLNPESLAPTFSAADATTYINLYGSYDKLNSATEKLFFLTNDEYSGGQSSSYLERVYGTKGFSCDVNNNS